MTQMANSEIDDHCERFDSEWSREISDSTGIQCFLSRIGVSHVDNPRLLHELVKISIERNWMAWDKRLPAVADRLTVSEVLDEFQRIPRLDNYQTLFAGTADFESYLNELATCELQCRALWGDAIGTLHYSDLGIDISCRVSGAQRKLRCVYYNQSRKAASVFWLRGCSYIGRQRSTDTQECFCSELKDGNRIVIAGRMEAEISRSQLEIQLLNPGYAIVTNLSQINPLHLNDKLLQPMENMMASFPFAIQLPGRKLYCN